MRLARVLKRPPSRCNIRLNSQPLHTPKCAEDPRRRRTGQPEVKIGSPSNSNVVEPLQELQNLWESYIPEEDKNPRTRWWTESYPLRIPELEQLQAGTEEASNEYLDGQKTDWTSNSNNTPVIQGTYRASPEPSRATGVDEQ